MGYARIAASVIIFLSFSSHSAWAVDIAACDQTVAKGDVGVLQVDLDCVGTFAAVRAGPRVAGVARVVHLAAFAVARPRLARGRYEPKAA